MEEQRKKLGNLELKEAQLEGKLGQNILIN